MAPAPTVRPAAISGIVKKTTTPTASLNSDSPAICTSSCFGARAVRSIPRTAIGSVGETMAPKSSAVAQIERQAADARRRAASIRRRWPSRSRRRRWPARRPAPFRRGARRGRPPARPANSRSDSIPSSSVGAEVDARHEPAREVVHAASRARRPPPAPATPRAPRPSRRWSAGRPPRRRLSA